MTARSRARTIMAPAKMALKAARAKVSAKALAKAKLKPLLKAKTRARAKRRVRLKATQRAKQKARTIAKVSPPPKAPLLSPANDNPLLIWYANTPPSPGGVFLFSDRTTYLLM